MVAAPSTQSGSPLQAVLEAVRATQAILEASQTARFGAKVRPSGWNCEAVLQYTIIKTHSTFRYATGKRMVRVTHKSG